MFTSINDFKERWTGHMDATMKILGALTDDSLGQAVAEDHRTLGRMAWHITNAIPEVMTRTGLEFHGAAADSPMPAGAAEMSKVYESVASQLLEQVEAKWSDADLMVEDDMYGQKWKRGFSLHILMEHEIHHRGQMTVLMRQAGLKVPGVLGTSKEEWAQRGMDEPEI